MNTVYFKSNDLFYIYGAHMNMYSVHGKTYQYAELDEIAGPFNSKEELDLNAAILGYSLKGELMHMKLGDKSCTYQDENNAIHPLEDLLGEKAAVV